MFALTCREPTPWGEGAWVWVRAAAPADLGGLAAIRRPTRTAGATDCAQGRGGGGDNAPKRHFFDTRLDARRRALAHTAQTIKPLAATLKPSAV